ncbi:DUF2157 domain-containing protein [uncultured Cohaesibacter sp.]|uniref:DUF2157 domain-containing protein n=1 Tax=uncultured Cohaesibacter sp. TaxID=1002546 RepID=UPI002AA7287C|nr:DUF2157 domain-containing protein [uncultured Cohaesibacter sp.]
MDLKPESPIAPDRFKGMALDRHLLDELAQRGSISAQVRLESLNWLHPAHLWARWAMVMLMAFGTGLVLTGIVFFFAFNWTSIPDLAKLALIEAGIILTALGAWLLPGESLAGRLLLMAAAVLTGVFLAVFGQIYQTGADAWQLFALWAALITLWTLVGRFLPLWVLWLGLINLAFYLWWDSTPLLRKDDTSALYLIHALIIGLVLLAREWLLPKEPMGEGSQFYWLTPQWTRWLLLAGMLVFLFPPLMIWIANWETANTQVALCALVAGIVTLILFLAFRYWRPDIPALAMQFLMICILVVMGLAILLFDNLFDSLGTTFFTGVSAIVCFAAAAGYLRHLLALGIDREEAGQ